MPSEFRKPAGSKLPKIDRRAKASDIIRMRKSNRWRTLSEHLRRLFPICQYPNCQYPSQSVHHINEAYDYPELYWEPTNLIPICAEHHAQINELERTNQKKLAVEIFDYWPQKVKESQKW